tara:strand:+ start:2015 stop:2848 length:834 start_codon:yes stop_codon:yes gene_type:complete
MSIEFPILDNHCHLDIDRGRGIAAVEDFSKSGGTHMIIVNQHSWKDGKNPKEMSDFEERFDQTIEITERATEILQGRAWSVLGIHPGLISRLVDSGYTVDEAGDFMCEGLDVAGKYISNGEGIAIKSGRPHYDVSEEIWEMSNSVLQHAICVAAKENTAIQLHTESTENLSTVARWANEAGLQPDRIVKHFSDGVCEGVIPSVISIKENLQSAAQRENLFLMETDYLDDMNRPGAVLGMKTVPKRTKWLVEMGYLESMKNAHVETPKIVYGIDTNEN